MSDKTGLTDIILTINGKKIQIPADEAKTLHRELDKLFGAKQPVYIPQPYPVYPNWPAQPYWIYYSAAGTVSSPTMWIESTPITSDTVTITTTHDGYSQTLS